MAADPADVTTCEQAENIYGSVALIARTRSLPGMGTQYAALTAAHSFSQNLLGHSPVVEAIRGLESVATTLAFDANVGQPAPQTSWAALDSSMTQLVSVCGQAGYALRWSAPSSSVPPAPTCAMFEGVHATYALVSRESIGGSGREYWPRITVTNGSQVPVTASVMGWGSATDTYAPDVPARMDWDGQSPTVSAGQSATFDIGKDTGETIFLAPGDKITAITMDLSVQMDESSTSAFGDPGRCDATITRAR